MHASVLNMITQDWSSSHVDASPFIHNVEKCPNILQKACDLSTARF